MAAALIDSARAAQVDQLIEDGSRAFGAGMTDEAMATWERAREMDPHNPALASLLDEGRAQHARETQRQLSSDRSQSMRRIRTELEKHRQLPERDMTGGGLRLRDVSDAPVTHEFLQERGTGRIMAELRNPVSLDFEDTDLRAVLKFLSEVTGINFLIDEDVFNQIGESDRDDPEAGRRIPISIFVTDLPLESALKGMLRQRGLDFSIERDFIYVSTPELLRASTFEQMEVRFYQLRDLARVTLPKVSAGPGSIATAQEVDVVEANTGGDLLERVRLIEERQIGEPLSSRLDYSTARLMAILRNFVPEVIEAVPSGRSLGSQGGGGGGARQVRGMFGPMTIQARGGAAGRQAGGTRTARRGAAEDRLLGGWSRVGEEATMQDRMHRLTRERRMDSNRREVLSRLDYDAMTNTLVARNTPSNLDVIERFLDRFDRPSRQVVIESRFMTVSMDDIHRVNTDLQLRNFDIPAAARLMGNRDIIRTVAGNLIGFGLAGSTQTDPGDFGDPLVGRQLGLSVLTTSGVLVEASVDLLTQLDNTETISAPKITTLSGKPAVIQDINSQTFITDAESEVETIQPPPGSDNEPIIVTVIDLTFTQIVTGIVLSVTPLILDDDTVRLWLAPDVSRTAGVSVFDIPVPDITDPGRTFRIEIPEIERQSLFTNVVVKNGETLVLGGLISNRVIFQERSTPFLRDIPLLGNFFRSSGEIVERRQLLIFVKPNIISAGGISYVRLK